MRLLIVEDEHLIRSGIRDDVRAIPQVEVAGECGSVAEAVDALQRMKIDLVLLDIQLPDGTGFDVVRTIGPAAMPAVIFITAYDQYAVQAFECSAVDYLLKPFDDLRLRASIEKVQSQLTQPASMLHRLESLLSNHAAPWLQRLVVRNEERIDLVPVDSIDWIESANNYAVLHCGAKTFVLGETLSGLEHRLDPQRFLRIHRQRIVNLSRVAALFPVAGGVYELELSDGTRFGTGRQYRDGIQKLIRS
ncbi:LytR/AlgR family response regulator transcription factor [Terriglobus roseus]|uniref:Two component transcriptional regulator, LytTR family n=1 Tax=Terriglobus roseus TaxID=392734 RepID=A0A1H4JYJ8_9BACT|nr:LytTR family DNA-binding domain-containing protein [Terriglobus roseus]SEB50928.1 two component transcriptional regulator, LytTR family [Terriglobus roseus]